MRLLSLGASALLLSLAGCARDAMAWQAYWNQGVPDPEGDAKRNDRWIEVKAVRR